MRGYTKTFVFWLPLMVLLTLVGWTLFGALPGAQMTGDEIAWLLQLPVVTCWALAAAGAAMLTMQVTGFNLSNEYRGQLTTAAAAGDRAARSVLRAEAWQWFGVMVIWCVFFFPHY